MTPVEPYTPIVASALAGCGIMMLALGAMWLVDGASRLGLRLGLSPFVIGLTVVGFGTSMPEFMVSILAALRGSGGLSLGNAVGSNIQNLLLVLGVAALLAPIRVVGGPSMIRRDLLFGLLPAVLLIGTAFSGHIGRLQATALLIIFSAFIIVCLRSARSSSTESETIGGHISRDILLAIVGIATLVIGADLMVRGCVSLARTFGVQEAVIGLTLVAFGTSLPELAASIAAAIKGETEISVGNVLGSNVFNLGLIIGTAFMIRPGTVPSYVILQDLPFLVVASVFLGFGILKNGKISRGEGLVLLLIFAAYFFFVVMRASA